jgi:hypothetical protein
MVYWQLKEIPGSKTIRHGIWILGGYSAVILLFLLALLDYRNLISILRFPSFLFPPGSDIAVLEYTADIAGEGRLVKTLTVNAQILFTSIFAHVGNYHSQYSSYIFADYRYPLLDRFAVPFVALGLIVSVVWAGRRTIIFAAPWRNVLAILVVFSLPLLFSVVVLKADGLLATLSPHRMYFCLFPLHFLVAAFLGWLGASSVNRVGKYGVALCLIAVFVGLIANLNEEQSRFQKQVFAPTWQKHGPEIKEIWDDHMPNLDRRDYSFASHLQQHAQYANVARQIAGKLRMQGDGQARGRARRIVFVDVNKFSEGPIAPRGVNYIAHRNFHSIFLALYVGQEGAQLNPVVMVDSERRPIGPYLMDALAYKGKPREYSALMDLDENGLLAYRREGGAIPIIVELTGDATYDILVTTPEEEEGAKSLLDKKHIPFEYVRI